LLVPTLLSPAGQEDSTLLASFEKVLGLALQPHPTMLGPSVKSDPIAFGRGDNVPLQFLTKKTQQGNTLQGSTIFITQIIFFLI